MSSHPLPISSIRLLLLLLLLGVPPRLADAQVAHDHGAAPEQLGRVEFPTSCNAAAQPRLERALALLHSFWWGEAEKAFGSVAEADPSCAMAYWGLALVHRGNWFAGPPSAAAERAGLAAARKALELAPPTERERAYAEAVLALYQDHEQIDYRTRSLAYEEAMRGLSERFPEDTEATIFHALSITSNATPGDPAHERQKRAGAILEPLFERQPAHPGLAHYLIHTYDAPPLAYLGAAAARKYGEIAPSVPHARHMPSHIFTRMGSWEESIRANEASAEAARAYEVAQGMPQVSFDRAHAWDYLVYAHLQRGEDAAARRLAEEVARSSAAASIATDYAFAAIPARVALERDRWAEAAALQVRPSPGFRAGEAITHFARGLGAARGGDAAAARAEVGALARIRDELASKRDTYWSEAVEAQRLAVEAWIAQAEGNVEESARLIARAAEIEQRIDKHPVTPGPILPARELEGDLRMMLGDASGAQRAYEAALRTEPNRARGTLAAARAAERAGDLATARRHYTAYLALMESADAGRPEVAEARAFLAR